MRQSLEAMKNTSQVVGREVGELKLPPGTTIGAIVRGSEVLIAHDDTLIQSDDHVILFLVDKKYVNEIERLFAPGALYFLVVATATGGLELRA